MRQALLLHVTPVENLHGILTRGLIPAVGPRSAACAEARPGIYCFSDQASLEDAFGGWLGEVFDERQRLALLAIKAPKRSDCDAAGYEVVLREAVPPRQITVLSRNIDDVLDLGALINQGALRTHHLLPDPDSLARPQIIPNKSALTLLRSAHLNGKNRHDPHARHVDLSLGMDYVMFDLPLASIAMDEPERGIVDATVDAQRVRREMLGLVELPPILIGGRFRSGGDKVRVLDGGHRVHLAHTRGALSIRALVRIDQWPSVRDRVVDPLSAQIAPDYEP